MRTSRLIVAVLMVLALVACTTQAAEKPAPPPTEREVLRGRIDAIWSLLPPVLADVGATIHFGCPPRVGCPMGVAAVYVPNQVWFTAPTNISDEALVYLIAHELAHGVDATSPLSPALNAAVAGAPVLAGVPFSGASAPEQLADCVAFVFYPEAAVKGQAEGYGYWPCPEPYRSQVAGVLA